MLKRKYAVFIFGLFFLFAFVHVLSSNPFLNQNKIASSTLQTKTTAKYTYMSYLCADNNLETYGKDDLNEMETGFDDSVTDVHVISLIDVLYGGTTAYYISHDNQPNRITSTEITISGLSSEENMGDPDTLITFVEYCMTYYPAEHYILDLWDHGSGWAICFDESSANDALTMGELRDALDDINSSTGNTIDILCMDACLMGTLEVAYEIRNHASILVASEDAVVASGFPYDDMIEDLCNDPDQDITTFASTIVDLFDNSMTYWSSTLSAVNLTILATVLYPMFTNFANNLYSYLDYGIKNEIYNARGASQEFYYPEFIDLYDFAQEFKIEASNFTIRQLAQSLLDNITPAIINEKHQSNPRAYGLSIYFPELQSYYETEYSTSFSLSNDSMWDEFLVKYYSSANFGLDLRYYSINDSLGNNNNTPDPGETILIDITLENIGDIEAGFANGTLICPDIENVTIQDGFKNYGSIILGGNGTRRFKFDINASCANYYALPFIIMTESIFNNYSVIRNFTFELIVGQKITLGGDTLQDATEITPGYIYGILPGLGINQEIWLKINCSKDYYLFLNLTGPDFTDFDAYVYDPSEDLATVAGKADYPDECSCLIMQEGYYYIKIDPYSGYGHYSLFVNITTELYEDGSFFGLAFTLPGSCAINGSLPSQAAGGYIFYRIILTPNQKLRVQLEGPTDADFDLYIYDPNLTQIASSMIASSSESCSIVAELQGYYYILIVPYSGTGDFTLQVELKDYVFPTWVFILIIVILIISVIVGVAYYLKLVRRSHDVASADYDVYDLDF